MKLCSKSSLLDIIFPSQNIRGAKSKLNLLVVLALKRLGKPCLTFMFVPVAPDILSFDGYKTILNCAGIRD